MIKLIAVDMDGTLLNNNKQTEEPQKKALKDAIEAGIHVVLCTGRPLLGTLALYRELGLGENNEYIIVNNGCSTHNTKDFSLEDYSVLTSEEIKELFELGRNYDLDFTVFNEDKFFFISRNGEKPNEYTVYDSKIVYMPIETVSLEEVTNEKYNIFKALYIGDFETLNRFEKEMPEEIKKKYNFPRSQKTILEAMPSSADKGKAIKKLAEKLGIGQDEVMALGDGNNDIEMLEYAGVSVSMGNAVESVKKVAKYITDTNENNGVAKAIYKYALNRES